MSQPLSAPASSSSSSSSSCAGAGAPSAPPSAAAIQTAFSEAKNLYRKLDFEAGKYNKRGDESVKLYSHRLDDKGYLVVKVKGVFAAPLERCFADLCSGAFMQAQDANIQSIERVPPKTDERCLAASDAQRKTLYSRRIKFRSLAEQVTQGREMEMYTCVHEADKGADKKEILSMTLDTHKSACYKKKYFPLYDVFTQVKLERAGAGAGDAGGATEFLHLAVYQVPTVRPVEYERQLAETMRRKYLAMQSHYAASKAAHK